MYKNELLILAESAWQQATNRLFLSLTVTLLRARDEFGYLGYFQIQFCFSLARSTFNLTSYNVTFSGCGEPFISATSLNGDSLCSKTRNTWFQYNTI